MYKRYPCLKSIQPCFHGQFSPRGHQSCEKKTARKLLSCRKENTICSCKHNALNKTVTFRTRLQAFTLIILSTIDMVVAKWPKLIIKLSLLKTFLTRQSYTVLLVLLISCLSFTHYARLC